MQYLLTLDAGTTAVKAGLFSQALEPVAFSIREYELLTPKTDWVELEPEVYWNNACLAVQDVLARAGIDPADVACITCTTQGETLIPVDASGNPLHRAIVWLDGRARQEAAWIGEKLNRLTLYHWTGLPEVNGYTPAAKLLWIKRNLPGVYRAAEKFLLLEDYLIYRLSGQFVTNPAVMCTTGYFDIQRDELWDEMLQLCGLDAAKIPRILPSGWLVGPLRPEAAQALGLPETVQVTTGAMDQVASAIGSGNVSAGIVTETTGTCQGVAATVDKVVFDSWSPVTYYSHAVQGKLLKIVINQTAGIAYKWFRNEFCQDFVREGEDAFRRMDELAAGEPALSRGVAFFPHMTGMQFPVVDERARGAFFGVGLDATRGCFLRAIMEGVGYMLRESMEKMDIVPEKVISLGGGARSELWCRIKASICNTEILVLEDQESTSLGAAMLGGLAMGMFESLEAASGKLKAARAFTPDPAEQKAYEAGYHEYLSMYRQFAPLFH
jgi:xylulokinase